MSPRAENIWTLVVCFGAIALLYWLGAGYMSLIGLVALLNMNSISQIQGLETKREQG
jgi:hypothetical protein